MKDSEIKSALLEIEKTIRSKKFNDWRIEFIRRNVNSFTFEDENKLVYTEIHREYETRIEKFVADCLAETVDMDEFMRCIPDYLEGPNGKDEETGRAVTMLLEVSDYQQFKEMMLCSRRELDEADSKHSQEQLHGIEAKGAELAGLDVFGMMHKCAELANAAEEAGWENLLTLDWMKIDKKPVEIDRRKNASEIYLRGVWTMNLSFKECCDMMFTISARRKLWDTNFESASLPQGGSPLDDDVVTSTKLNFGYLVNLVMFGGQAATFNCRYYRRWDHPVPGSVTYAMVPWNLKLNCIDETFTLMTLKTGTIAPHPTFPDKCVMTSLETNGMGAMPTWALHFMTRATAPQMMRALESRYIANARNKGDFADVTPEGRAADAHATSSPAVAEEKNSRK